MKGASPLALAALLALVPAAARAQQPSPDDPPVVTPADLPPPEPPSNRTVRPFLSLEGGYAFQSLYGVPMTSADLSAAVGGRWDTFAAGAILEAMPGSTQDGLQTITLTLGPLFEGRFDRLRVGGGVRLGAFNVNRITTNGGLFSLTAGAFARVSYDLVDLDDARTQAIFVILKGSIDSVDAALLGASCGLGVRF
jgi:hypothetical protein